jgi:hypothetical protein
MIIMLVTGRFAAAGKQSAVDNGQLAVSNQQ